MIALSAMAQMSDYVDLGLPSGTLWKNKNEVDSEMGMYYICSLYHNENFVAQKFDGKLPTLEQFNELRYFCDWKWNGRGYTITGMNGNYIILPAAGNSIGGMGDEGYYACSTKSGVVSRNISMLHRLYFDKYEIDTEYLVTGMTHMTVRLVR
ncbi:MAG: hypothetical protein IKB64_04295 [Paludibacteraceae bacterium]|nr:hypothetical protein [Paludibacteraceae bacterium]